MPEHEWEYTNLQEAVCVVCGERRWRGDADTPEKPCPGYHDSPISAPTTDDLPRPVTRSEMWPGREPWWDVVRAAINRDPYERLAAHRRAAETVDLAWGDCDALAALHAWIEDRDRWKAEAVRLREQVNKIRAFTDHYRGAALMWEIREIIDPDYMGEEIESGS